MDSEQEELLTQRCDTYCADCRGPLTVRLWSVKPAKNRLWAWRHLFPSALCPSTLADVFKELRILQQEWDTAFSTASSRLVMGCYALLWRDLYWETGMFTNKMINSSGPRDPFLPLHLYTVGATGTYTGTCRLHLTAHLSLPLIVLNESCLIDSLPLYAEGITYQTFIMGDHVFYWLLNSW
jgi:hypothetical protein